MSPFPSPSSGDRAGIQALIVFTDPVCVYTIDVVHEGVTSVREVAERVSARLGVTCEHAEAVLDGLVGVGFVDRTGRSTIADPGLDRYCDRVDEAGDRIDLLRAQGSRQHADDLVAAIDAAWNTRSTDPVKRWRAAGFRSSAAGVRHAERVAARTLGQFSDEAACGEAASDEAALARVAPVDVRAGS